MTSLRGIPKMATTMRSHVILTEKIRQWIRILLTTAKLPSETKEEFKKYATARRSSGDTKPLTIPFNLVKLLHDYIRNDQGVFSIFYLDLLNLNCDDFHSHEFNQLHPMGSQWRSGSCDPDPSDSHFDR